MDMLASKRETPSAMPTPIARPTAIWIIPPRITSPVRREGEAPSAVRTPAMVAQLDEILADTDKVQQAMFGADGPFKIHWHKYGDDAVLKSAEGSDALHEVGVLADVVADTQDLAHDVAYDLLTRLGFWRYPGRYTTAGNIAVTLSPGVIDVGEVYEFSIYHSMRVSDYREIFRTELSDAG